MTRACLNQDAPTIGVVACSTGVFSETAKAEAETQMRSVFHRLKGDGLIDEASVFLPDRVTSRKQAQEAADTFVKAKADACVILNSGFPPGDVFLTFATDPYLCRIPMIVAAPPEAEQADREWSTNAYCGLIMNNYVAKQVGRHMFTMSGWPREDAFQRQLERLLRVVRTIKLLRRGLVGRFGDAPTGFHSATANQLAYARMFGTQVATIDLTAVMETFRTAKATGGEGEATFTDADVEATYQEMITGRDVQAQAESVRNAARLYHAFKALIEANGFTSVSIRCWPEILDFGIRTSACLSLAWLLSKGVALAAACEGDWPSAVTQYIAGLLTGEPSPSLDFVNHVSAKPIVQLGHCGVGIPGYMAHEQISTLGPDRQAGRELGPTCIGQYVHGVKTGMCMTQGPDGAFKMLVFTGENRPDTDLNLRYCAADIEVRNPRKLDELILRHGFGHHLAMAFGDISEESRLLCDFYGIEYLNPDTPLEPEC